MLFFVRSACLFLFLLAMPISTIALAEQSDESSQEPSEAVKKAIEEHRQKWCHVTFDPKINVIPVTDRVEYDFTLTKAELGSFDIDTDSPYGKEAIVDVGGLMRGRIQVESEVELDEEKYKNLYCVFYKKIDIKISITPIVYIAKEYKKGTCMFDEVKRHENKHVLVDQKIVNKYAKKVGARLVSLINKEMLVGPIRSNKLELATDHLRMRVKNEIAKISNQMYDERNRRQQLVDSLGEYQDVSDYCRGND